MRIGGLALLLAFFGAVNAGICIYLLVMLPVNHIVVAVAGGYAVFNSILAICSEINRFSTKRLSDKG